MKTLRVSSVSILAFFFTLTHTPASAGKIDPAFREVLDRLPEGEYARALVMMAERVDTRTLVTALGGRASLEVRHEVVVRALREKARSTQGGFIRYLEVQERLGEVSAYRPFWITNMIACDCDGGGDGGDRIEV